MRSIPFVITPIALLAVTGSTAGETSVRDRSAAAEKPPVEHFQPEEKQSEGSVTIGGKRIDYQALAGTEVVHPKGWDDAAEIAKAPPEHGADDDKAPPAEAAMFFVAYVKKAAKPEARPITFLFNGGPGSSSVWLHMGAFGPRRVVTLDNEHTAAAPYQAVNNAFSLLDASDLVFVDAPGTGFGRIAGKDKEKAFFGVDQDAHAFAEFITGFLTRYGRWNSPKYIFGESYGTNRAANLVNILETDRSVDLNGVILLSQCLSYDVLPDEPSFNPGVDQPYILSLPTYAATAWYHHKLADPRPELTALVDEVERFAVGDYASALTLGSGLDPAKRRAIAAKLHDYTGLPTPYIEKADLRITPGEFEKTLQDDTDTTTGRLDTRFSGPTMDPLSKEAEYDPQSAAISSAYVSVFNDYVRHDLKFGEGRVYKPEIDVEAHWDFAHQPPGRHEPLKQQVNVMPDLAAAMKYNPNLKVMLNAGYFDLATPFYEGIYEMRHLPIPLKLQDNIEYAFYESGHMVYAHEASLEALHAKVAAFIAKTANVKPV
jgi:carboxypeptidase C (cathepsin A)